MAQGVTNGPRATDKLLNFILTAEPLKPAGMIRGQGMIIPADRPADLDMIGVDSPGGVVSGRDTDGDPILQPAQLAQPASDGPYAGPRLPFQLHQIQF